MEGRSEASCKSLTERFGVCRKTMDTVLPAVANFAVVLVQVSRRKHKVLFRHALESLVYVDECRYDETLMEVVKKHYERAPGLPVLAAAPASAPQRIQSAAAILTDSGASKLLQSVLWDFKRGGSEHIMGIQG